MFKITLQIFVGVALVMQLAGCYYSGNDRHYHPFWHHDHVVEVHVHG